MTVASGQHMAARVHIAVAKRMLRSPIPWARNANDEFIPKEFFSEKKSLIKKLQNSISYYLKIKAK